MEKKTGYCLFFLALLVPYTVLGATLKKDPSKPKREKRAVVAVAIPVWSFLLGLFGVVAVDAATREISYNNPTDPDPDCDDILGRCATECIPWFEDEAVTFSPSCGTNMQCCIASPDPPDSCADNLGQCRHRCGYRETASYTYDCGNYYCCVPE